MVSVLCFIAEHDADLLPAFVRHYRQLGVQRLRFCLHGPWSDPSQQWLRAQPDCDIHSQLNGPFSEALKCRQLTAMARELPGTWVITVDADEFLALPHPSLHRTIAALQIMGVSALPCWLMQRHAADGHLPALTAEASIDDVFPQMQFGLCEAMGVETPVWKEKFSLAFVGPQFAVQRGFHFPPNGQPCEHVPMRGVVHHFKWRAALRVALGKPRGAQANTHEQQAYAQWLSTHDWTLPLRGAQRCTREALPATGLLSWPDRQQRHALALRRRLAASDDAATRERLAHRLASTVTNPAGLSRRDLHEGLSEAPGRIALVSFELFDGGGIATAIGITAELLAAAGHEVHLLFCPFGGERELWAGHHEHWAARGVRLHYLPRRARGEPNYPNNYLMSRKLADRLADIAADVIHVVDAEAYGRAVLLQRLAAYRFTDAAVLAVYHGPNEWHFMAGDENASDNHLEVRHALATQCRHADWHCAPSRYMRRWIAHRYEVPAQRFVAIANPLGGAARVGGLRPQSSASPAPVTELVFFGRLSERKGLSTFVRAVAAVRRRHAESFRITLLGMPDAQTPVGPLLAAPAFAGLEVQWLRNHGRTDALNYLRTRPCVAVAPSLIDNLPYTVYEALANGIALITTDVGGIRELVDPADHARLCAPEDDDALARRLLEALTVGISPMRLAFDWLARDVECLALHGCLLRDARRRRSLPESEPESAPVATPPTDVFEVDVQARAAPAQWLATVASSAQPRHLLRAERSAYVDADVLGRMHALMNATDADVVITDCLVVPSRPIAERARLVVPDLIMPAEAGPPAVALTRNVMGAGCMLVQHRALDYWADFNAGPLSALNWQQVMLNHLVARGGTVVGLPAPLTVLRLQEGEDAELYQKRSLGIRLYDALRAAVPPGLLKGAAAQLVRTARGLRRRGTRRP